ncbi:tRNA (guanine-N(7)-)-methyltransferase (tRNA(m7G46)-methyltransferase) [Dispira simplex]|nr:tRNA (guanine-N(7)-)-methyltransferase (tRNA(m7G46)-methyltransferase) [Dispira simplex]
MAHMATLSSSFYILADQLKATYPWMLDPLVYLVYIPLVALVGGVTLLIVNLLITWWLYYLRTNPAANDWSNFTSYPRIPPLAFTYKEPAWATEDEASLEFTDTAIVANLPSDPPTSSPIEAQKYTSDNGYSATNHHTSPDPDKMSEPEELDRMLNLVIDHVLRDFLKSWFHNISTDGRFPHSVRLQLTSVLRGMVPRTQRVDLPLLLSNRLIPMVTAHLHQFRQAERRAQREWLARRQRSKNSKEVDQQRGSISALSENWRVTSQEKADWDRLVYEQYDRRMLHPALLLRQRTDQKPNSDSNSTTSPLPSSSSSSGAALGPAAPVWVTGNVSKPYLQHLCTRILPLLCPPSMLESHLQKVLIRELVVGTLLQPICCTLIDPDTWNHQLNQYLTKAIEEQNMVNLLRRALHEQSQPVDLPPAAWNATAEGVVGWADTTGLATVAARLQDAASQAAQSLSLSTGLVDSDTPTFDEFVHRIKKCQNLEEAQTIRNQIVTQIRTKRILVEGRTKYDIVHGQRVKDVNIYINRLFVAKKLAEKQIMLLGNKVYPEEQSDFYPEVNEVKNNVEISRKSGTWRNSQLSGTGRVVPPIVTRGYHREKHPAVDPLSSTPAPFGFQEILTNPSSLSYFTEYMDLIGKVNNLQFWLTIEGLKRHPLVTTENRLDTVIWSIYRTYFSHEVVDDLEIAPEVYKDLVVHFGPFLVRQRGTGSVPFLSTVQEEHPVQSSGSKENSQLERSNSVGSSLSQSSWSHQNQRLFELIIVAQHDVFESMKRLHYPQFLRSGLYQRFLASYTLAQSKPVYATSIASSSRASSLVRRSSLADPTSQPSPLSSVGQNIQREPLSPGSVDTFTHLSRRKNSQLNNSGFSSRLANLSPSRRTSMQRMSPLFPKDRSSPSTSLVTATVTVQSNRNSVEDSSNSARSDRSSVLNLVVPDDSVISPVNVDPGRLRSSSRLSQWSQRSGSTVPKGNSLGPWQTSSSLPMPTLSHTMSVTGVTTSGTVSTVADVPHLEMGDTLKPGPPVQRRLSEDVGDPNDIPDTDLLATGAVEAVQAALSSIVRNTPARASRTLRSATCNVRFEENEGDRARRTATDLGTGDTLVESTTKGLTVLESCDSQSDSASARSRPQENAEQSIESSSNWWSYPTLMWQNNETSSNSLEDNNPDEVTTSDDKSTTLLTSFLLSPIQYFGGKSTSGITDSESIPEDGSTKPGTEVTFSGPTRDTGTLIATSTAPTLATTDEESDREDSVVDETVLQNSVYQAPPGDLLLSNKIAKIAQELDRKRQQQAIVLALIDKAKILDKLNELRILQKSQSALNREIQLLSFQRQQYERQAKENVIVPKVTRITIPSCTRGFTRDPSTEARVEFGERRGTATTRRVTQQVALIGEWPQVHSSGEGSEVPEGVRPSDTASIVTTTRRNPHYSKLNPNPLRSSLFLDSVDHTANVSDYPVDLAIVASHPSQVTSDRNDNVTGTVLRTRADSSSGLSLTTPSMVPTMTTEIVPSTVQAPATAFTLYLIEIQQMSADGSYDSGWVVARRYREFSALHQQLKRRFSIVRQYDFPRKHHLPTLSKLWPLNPARREFPWPPHVENRRLALEKYLQGITQHKEVCQSLELRWFLSQQQRELSALSDFLGRESSLEETVKSGLGLSGVMAPTGVVVTSTRGEFPSGESASSSTSLNESGGNLSTLSVSAARTVGVSKDTKPLPRCRVGGRNRAATTSSATTSVGHPNIISNTQLTKGTLQEEQRHQRSSSFLNPVQKTIADGLEDIVGSPIVLDMISEQLSRQVVGFTPTSHPFYRLTREDTRGKHHPYATTGVITGVATNGTSMADPLCNLIIEVFELKAKNNWLRRQAISMLLRTLLGNTIDWWFRDTVQDLVAIPQLTQYLRTLHDNLWPGNRPLTPPTPRTDEEKFATWEEAGAKWRFYMPTVCGSLVGRRNARRGANRIFHLMQNPHLNENLVYFVLDELVLTLFPELLPRSAVSL